MATPSTISIASQIPGFNSAIENLVELGIRMEMHGKSFSKNDITNIELVIDAIRELDYERNLMQQRLETETIDASILRHKLKFYPNQMKDEIDASKIAARESNSDIINELQKSLSNMTEEIASLDKKCDELDKENIDLMPKRNAIQDKHVDIIHSLNERMADKAAKQITLNETRNKLRETNERIIDLEDGIVELKELLITERAEIRMEKKKLKKSTYDTSLKFNEQQEVNSGKKKEMDGLYELLMASENKISNLKNNIKKFETSKSKLTQDEQLFSTKLKTLKNENENFTVQIIKLKDEQEEAEKNFVVLENETKASIIQLENSNREIEKRCTNLQEERNLTSKKLKDEKTKREKRAVEIRETQANLNLNKEELAKLIEETARLRQEIIDMEERMIEINETHEKYPEKLEKGRIGTQNITINRGHFDNYESYVDNKSGNYKRIHGFAIISMLNKQIEESRAKLGKERKDRMEAQVKRDEVQRKIDEINEMDNIEMTKLTKSINDGKKKHDALAQEGTDLQVTIRNSDNSILTLSSEIERLQKLNEEQIEKFNKEIIEYNRELERLQLQIQHNSVVINEKTEPFKKLEMQYEEKTEEYENLKKQVVAEKNRRKQLENSIKLTKEKSTALKEPSDNIHKEIAVKRLEFRDVLQKRHKEESEIEGKIYEATSKLETINIANDNFKKRNDNFQNQIKQNEKESQLTLTLIDNLQDEINKLKRELFGLWASDKDLDSLIAQKHGLLLDGISNQLQIVDIREGVLNSVSDGVSKELKFLSSFLDRAAEKRPIDDANQEIGIINNNDDEAIDEGIENDIKYNEIILRSNKCQLIKKSLLPPQPFPSELISTPRPKAEMLQLKDKLTEVKPQKVLRKIFDSDYVENNNTFI